MLQESEPEPGLTVRECLQLYAGYYRAPRQVDETLALVGLDEQADERAGALSGGQRRRLDVALALIGDPELIFLDEPTTGFDPSARRAAWEVIGGLRDLGKTVFLTTHYMEEAERLADRIAVIAAGEIVAAGHAADARRPPALGRAHLLSLPAGTALARAAPSALRARRASGRRAADRCDQLQPSPADLHSLSGWALERGSELDDLEVRQPTLEDVYLKLTAKNQTRSERCFFSSGS